MEYAPAEMGIQALCARSPQILARMWTVDPMGYVVVGPVLVKMISLGQIVRFLPINVLVLHAVSMPNVTRVLEAVFARLGSWDPIATLPMVFVVPVCNPTWNAWEIKFTTITSVTGTVLIIAALFCALQISTGKIFYLRILLPFLTEGTIIVAIRERTVPARVATWRSIIHCSQSVLVSHSMLQCVTAVVLQTSVPM